MKSATAKMSRNKANLCHHAIHQRRQSCKNLLSHSTVQHPHGLIHHRTDAATHHQVSELPPEMRHQHPNKQISTWPPWNGTRQSWLQKLQQQPYIGCAYKSCNSTSSINGFCRGWIKNITIGEIYQTRESSTPIITQCTPTREEENEVQEIPLITYVAT